MAASSTRRAAGTGSSILVECCQVCGGTALRPVLFLGYLPPVNQMRNLGDRPAEQPSYPAAWLHCSHCELIQLGLIVDPAVLFPPEYPYSSGTTRILRENFAGLYQECREMMSLDATSLVLDIGSNDGTLLENFRKGGHRVHGIEPTLMGNLANERGIPTTMAFFTRDLAARMRTAHGPATVVTATNVFAHMEGIHEVVEGITSLMGERGVFISESHYVIDLIKTLQYDTIYHEHLRYYSLGSLRYLLGMHGLEVFHARRIQTHGGSIRVYAARAGDRPVRESVQELLKEEASRDLGGGGLETFKRRVVQSKLELHALLLDIKRRGGRIYGIGAPSRASTLIHYAGLDDGILECVLEVRGSHKIGKYMPGTLIPVVEESRLFEDQPEYAMLLSWHITGELVPKLRQKGYRGRYIVPLPSPAVLDG